MTSRRKFLKAGLLSGLTVLPTWHEASSLKTTTNFSLATDDDALFLQVRQQLLVPANRIYLNTGSLGPSPRSVIDAVQAAMHQLEANPVVENWGQLGNNMESVRKKLAAFIKAELSEVVITRNTTEGLNLIAQSIPLQAGDEILTTTLEHGGAEVGLEYVEKNKGVIIKKVALPTPANSQLEIINTIEKNITPKTKAVLLSHINTVTGLVMPLAEISKITRAKGIYLIADGAQAPGLIPVNVSLLGVDAYAASGHKWLLGPKETGFVFLRREFQDKIKPIFTFSGNESYTASSGTRNVSTIAGLGAAIDFHTQLGVEKIHQRTLQIRNYCVAELKKLKGIMIISPEEQSLSCGIVSFTPGAKVNSDLADALRKKDIIVKTSPQLNAIRISCHVFVSKSDIDSFINQLKIILG